MKFKTGDLVTPKHGHRLAGARAEIFASWQKGEEPTTFLIRFVRTSKLTPTALHTEDELEVFEGEPHGNFY